MPNAIVKDKVGDKQWRKCPACGSRDSYYRIKRGNFKCRRCPTVFKADYMNEVTYQIPERGNV